MFIYEFGTRPTTEHRNEQNIPVFSFSFLTFSFFSLSLLLSSLFPLFLSFTFLSLQSQMKPCSTTFWVVFIPGSKYQMVDFTQFSCILVLPLSKWISFSKPTFQNCQISAQLVPNLRWRNPLALRPPLHIKTHQHETVLKNDLFIRIMKYTKHTAESYTAALMYYDCELINRKMSAVD